jgi:hypothetical protein
MVCSNLLDPLDSFMPPNFFLTLLIIEDFFCVSYTCPQVWGVILAKINFQENIIMLKKGL